MGKEKENLSKRRKESLRGCAVCGDRQDTMHLLPCKREMCRGCFSGRAGESEAVCGDEDHCSWDQEKFQSVLIYHGLIPCGYCDRQSPASELLWCAAPTCARLICPECRKEHSPGHKAHFTPFHQLKAHHQVFTRVMDAEFRRKEQFVGVFMQLATKIWDSQFCTRLHAKIPAAFGFTLTEPDRNPGLEPQRAIALAHSFLAVIGVDSSEFRQPDFLDSIHNLDMEKLELFIRSGLTKDPPPSLVAQTGPPAPSSVAGKRRNQGDGEPEASANPPKKPAIKTESSDESTESGTSATSGPGTSTVSFYGQQRSSVNPAQFSFMPPVNRTTFGFGPGFSPHSVRPPNPVPPRAPLLPIPPSTMPPRPQFQPIQLNQPPPRVPIPPNGPNPLASRVPFQTRGPTSELLRLRHPSNGPNPMLARLPDPTNPRNPTQSVLSGPPHPRNSMQARHPGPSNPRNQEWPRPTMTQPPRREDSVSPEQPLKTRQKIIILGPEGNRQTMLSLFPIKKEHLKLESNNKTPLVGLRRVKDKWKIGALSGNRLSLVNYSKRKSLVQVKVDDVHVQSPYREGATLVSLNVAGANWTYVVGGSVPDPAILHYRTILRKVTPFAPGKAKLRSIPPQPDMNVARQKHGTVILDGWLYVIGGQGENYPYLDSMERLKLGERGYKFWWNCEALPRPLRSFGVVADKGKILVVGGETEHEMVSSGTYIFDPIQKRWDAGPDLNVPRAHLSLAVCDGAIYAIGGRGQNFAQLSVERLSGDWRQWTVLPEKLPIPVVDAGLVVI